MDSESAKVLFEIENCRVCEGKLAHNPRPIVRFSANSRIVIIGQAPGVKVHTSGVPWDDKSGDRLRSWLKVTKDQFYNKNLFAIVPMGFCYPGKGKSGDLPPRPECADLWMNRVLNSIKNPDIILLIGQYSQKYFLKCRRRKSLTETVKNWNDYLPDYFVLPHPSPRNNIWLKKNNWFEKTNLPYLQNRIFEIIKSSEGLLETKSTQ